MNTHRKRIQQLTTIDGYQGTASAHTNRPTFCNCCGKEFGNPNVAAREWNEDGQILCTNCNHLVVKIDTRIDMMCKDVADRVNELKIPPAKDKVCSCCGKERHLEFFPNKWGRECRSCLSAKRREQRKKAVRPVSEGTPA